MKHYICIDIGGTSIKHGVMDETLLFHRKSSSATPKTGGGDMRALVEEVIAGYLTEFPDSCGICISSAGIINSDLGFVLEANDELTPGYTGTQLAGPISARFGLPCYVENDVNCAALAEFYAGAAAPYTSSLTLTIGTGIGGAFILDGQLLKGHTYSACEVGYSHMTGGSFEELAATSVLVSKVASRLSLPAGSINGKWIFDQALSGNAVCITALEEMCDTLAKGIANLCYVLNPEVVVIGGGISGQEEYLRPLLEKGLAQYLIPPILEGTHLAFAKQKNDAGMIGAYYNFLSRSQSHS